jgi:hypothetical protein
LSLIRDIHYESLCLGSDSICLLDHFKELLLVTAY